jgi:hypothetical protein
VKGKKGKGERGKGKEGKKGKGEKGKRKGEIKTAKTPRRGEERATSQDSISIGTSTHCPLLSSSWRSWRLGGFYFPFSPCPFPPSPINF